MKVNRLVVSFGKDYLFIPSARHRRRRPSYALAFGSYGAVVMRFVSGKTAAEPFPNARFQKVTIYIYICVED